MNDSDISIQDRTKKFAVRVIKAYVHDSRVPLRLTATRGRSSNL